VRPVDRSCDIEPFSLLLAEIAYCSPNGPELAYRFERFPKQAG
jgi:hypothetical protein